MMFATIWYSGVVIMTMGFVGMSEDHCNDLKIMMENDIHSAYVESGGVPINGYEEQYFEVTCENERLETYYD